MEVTLTNSPVVAVLQSVAANWAARYSFQIPKVKPGVSVLPQDDASAAKTPVQIVAWGAAFQTRRTLTSAPASGVRDAVLRADAGGNGGVAEEPQDLSSTGITMQVVALGGGRGGLRGSVRLSAPFCLERPAHTGRCS